MNTRTGQVHGSARLKCHETEKQTLPSSVGRRGAPDGLAELSVKANLGSVTRPSTRRNLYPARKSVPSRSTNLRLTL